MQHDESRNNFSGINTRSLFFMFQVTNQPLGESPYYDPCSITNAVIEPNVTVFLEYDILLI